MLKNTQASKPPYDYLIVGAGLFGSVFAHEAKKRGKTSLVIDKRNHIGGNTYCDNQNGIHIHQYGAHIFHTNSQKIWNYVNKFTSFNNYINSPLANYKGKLYSLPFNMNTFYQLWGVKTPEQAKDKIREETKDYEAQTPNNLEQQALSLVGRDIYETLIKGYTTKQWGRTPDQLPAFIIKRVPLRFTFDNNYYTHRYQGIPLGGYNTITEKLLEGIDVRLSVDFFQDRASLQQLASRIVFTGKIDEFYDYKFGTLQYRSLRFKHEHMNISNYQGNAVINYTDMQPEYTRIIEHKHFEFGTQSNTIITKEYPQEYKDGLEPYYPINDQHNNDLYRKYKDISKNDKHIIFGGRLAEYKYYDMDQVIGSCLTTVAREFDR